jgi:hypothetical protein
MTSFWNPDSDMDHYDPEHSESNPVRMLGIAILYTIVCTAVGLAWYATR